MSVKTISRAAGGISPSSTFSFRSLSVVANCLASHNGRLPSTHAPSATAKAAEDKIPPPPLASSSAVANCLASLNGPPSPPARAAESGIIPVTFSFRSLSVVANCLSSLNGRSPSNHTSSATAKAAKNGKLHTTRTTNTSNPAPALHSEAMPQSCHYRQLVSISSIDAAKRQQSNGATNGDTVVAKLDTRYQREVDHTLQLIFDKLEEASLPQIEELSFADGALTVDTGSSGVFVLNKHYITRQIWYSSPNSGADYFEFSSDPRWMSVRSGVSVFDKLQRDLTKATGTTINFGV